MEMEKMMRSLKKIEMPEGMRERILEKCRLEAAGGVKIAAEDGRAGMAGSGKAVAMRSGKAAAAGSRMVAMRNGMAAIVGSGKAAAAGGVGRKEVAAKRFARPGMGALAAAAVLCLCFTLGAAAAVREGYFKNIVSLFGAVTGTQYEQATEELGISAIYRDHTVLVDVTMLYPDKFPYREAEELGLDSYRILDGAGKVVLKGSPTELFEVTGNHAEAEIPLENLAPGVYRLEVTSLVFGAKADQPLCVSGGWECAFMVE